MQMTPKTIIIGGLAVVLTVVAFVVFLPYAVFKPAPTITTNQYTALEKEGLQLYKSNGCVYCHSQFTRPKDVTPSKPSEAGEYVYDRPHQLGTLRTGPDLANIGYKRGDAWEADHLKNPRKYTPNSIMPNFSYLTDHQVKAIVAYLNRLGNKRNATTDLMIPTKYYEMEPPFPLDINTWTAGRRIYTERCLTCHGCAGKGDGPYAYLNNARPADLRQPRFQNLKPSWDFWRVSEGVPGTVMPMWKQSLSENDRWLVVNYIRGAFMDMVPHYTDEGDLPAKYKAVPDPMASMNTSEAIDYLDAGKAIFVDELCVLPRVPRHRQRTRRPRTAADAAGLLGYQHLQGLGPPGLLLAGLRVAADAGDAPVEVLVRRGPAMDGRQLRARHARVPRRGQRAGRPGDPRRREAAQDPADHEHHAGARGVPAAVLDVPRRRRTGRRALRPAPQADTGELHRSRREDPARRRAVLEDHPGPGQRGDAAVGPAARGRRSVGRARLHQEDVREPERTQGSQRRAARAVSGARRRRTPTAPTRRPRARSSTRRTASAATARRRSATASSAPS